MQNEHNDQIILTKTEWESFQETLRHLEAAESKEQAASYSQVLSHLIEDAKGREVLPPAVQLVEDDLIRYSKALDNIQ
ncbi:hypothetical protein [Tumebacillus permanentifrigoris]|uniref:Uncharacterized protein n=1 Tax=Tumebacillus permanentifrigoris TaxID=378543 RepID=A0A316DQA9_9BACL|nr:hypothetical protein [Tumebacillus permanentifrigoris]PWK05401.1 hypothetical protein C7459_12326 [Tumebacillus permanentifrigoris]